MTAKQSIVGEFPKFNALKAESFVVNIQKALESYKATIAEVKTNDSPTWSNSIQPLEEAAEYLDRVWSQLNHLNAVANTTEIREVYEHLLPKITDFHTDIMQDEQLYNLYLRVSLDSSFATLSAAQKSIVQHELRDFKLSGVGLQPEQREIYKNLAQRLSALENDFANNLLDATEGWVYHVMPEQKDLLAGLPDYVIENAKQKATATNKDGWVLTLDQSVYYPLMDYAHNQELRKTFNTAMNTRASDQGPMAGKWDNSSIIDEILQIRQKLAELLGFANYAEYSLVPKMASAVQQVKHFLQDIADKTKPKALQEYKALCGYAKQKNNLTQLEPWDIAYYSTMLKKERYDVSEEELRIYFPEPRVLTGLFKLVRKLYKIEIEEVVDFEKWHSSVRMFRVVDQQNKIRGHFYIDLYAREGKRGGAWMAECLSRIRFANETLQKPIAYLNCNFAAPAEHKPGLFTHDDVITLFHEFGHTLHHVLTQVDQYSVAGINGVAWDAVELPSQFMENWCWEWSVIEDITEHVRTGEPLPRELYDNLLASKNFHSAMGLMRQLEYSIFDLRIHAHESGDDKRSVQEILNDVRKQIAIVPIAECNRFQNGFSHIFAGGYAAGYYSYLWAEVLSCDAFDKFSMSGLYNEEVGKAFLTEILEQGGSKPAMELFVAFAGREPEVDALLRHRAVTQTE